MNFKITAVAVITLIVGVFSSCIGSSDYTTTTYDDALITAFSLGTVKRAVTTKASDGVTDSTYTYSYSASAYPMSIDQINGKIYNIDSLLNGTQVDKIVTTIATQNNGVIQIKDSADVWQVFSTGDTVDYSAPRQFRIVSSDLSTYREYTAQVNVHNEVADSFTWSPTAKDTLMGMTLSNIYTTLYNNPVSNEYEMYLLCIAHDDDSAYGALYSSVDGDEWGLNALPPNMTDADTVVVAANQKLYMISGGQLYQTVGAPSSEASWELVPGAPALRTLCGGNDNMLYAINANKQFVYLKAGESSFKVDSMETSQYYSVDSLLPYVDVNFMTTSMPTNPTLTHFIVVANSEGSTEADNNTAVVWNKIYDDTEIMPWTYTPFPWKNEGTYGLPDMVGLTAVYYSDGIVAMGGKSNSNTAKTPFSRLYYSPDYGITWHDNTDIALPKDYDCTDVKCVRLLSNGKTIYFIAIREVTVDGVKGSELTVWRAHQNKLIWNDTQHYFK